MLRNLTLNFWRFVQLILAQRYLIVSMAYQSIYTKYAGSFLGLFWAIVHPIAMITVLAFVFELGFRMKPSADAPFIVWFTAAAAAWNTFSEIVGNSSGLVINMKNLVKKTFFQSHILPIISLVEASVTHAIYLGILFVLLIIFGMDFSWTMLLFPYYMIGMFLLALGLSWLCSSLNVFLKDLGQVVNVILQIGFWGTPILWNIQMLPAWLQPYMSLNPMFHVVQGYRDCFIHHVGLFQDPWRDVYFWSFTIIALLVGATAFKRLKPHFADVL